MDLAKYKSAAEQGAVMEVRDPAGDVMFKEDGSTPITITLAGTESKRWRKAEDAVGDKRLERAGTRATTTAKSMREAREDRAFLLAAVTLAWDGIVVDGNPLECNQKNAKDLYIQYDFITTQVDAFLAERKNFLPVSSAN